MKRILATAIFALSLLVAAPIMASTGEPQLDLCENIPGIQTEVPKGFRVVGHEVDGIIILECFSKNGH